MNKRQFTFLITLWLLFACQLTLQAQHIRIDYGQKVTRFSNVTLRLDYTKATEMKIWNGLEDKDREAASWQPYKRYMRWNLPDGDGKKIVSVIFRKKDMKESEHHIASIMYDTTPPTIDSVLVGNDTTGITAQLLNNRIKFYVRGARKMMVSNEPDFRYAGWQDYKREILWTIPKGDGEKSVYFKFKDKVGNETEVHKETIVLDTRPPEREFLHIINKKGESTKETAGWVYVNNEDKLVDLQIKAEDAIDMMLSDDASFYGSKWQPYSDTVSNWQLTKPIDGINYVFVKFRDDAGNISLPLSDKVIVDTHAPNILNVNINGDATLTNTPQVRVSIEGFKGDLMQIGDSEDLSEAAVQVYQDYLDWELKGEDGEYSVYVQLIDSAKNYSEMKKGTIVLDRTPPNPQDIILEDGSERTRNSKIKVQLKAEEAHEMQYGLTNDFSKDRWILYKEEPFYLPLGNIKGARKVYARFRDQAGNISEVIQDSIIIEEVPVLEEFMIDAGAAYCTHPKGKVKAVVNARGAAEMQVSQEPRFLRAEWEPFQTEFPIELEGEEGEKTIYIKVRSKTQTEAATTLQASIIWDKTPPSDCSIELNDGEASIFNQWVYARVKAQEAAYMQISQNPTFDRQAWVNYHNDPVEIRVPKSGGWKVLYARFKDEKGNISEVVSDSILMEIMPTAGYININNGAEFCTHPEKKVTIQVAAKHAKYMKIGGSPDFSSIEWQPYKKETEWTLPGEDGLKTVYLKFKSDTETESDLYTDYIELDRTPPQNGKVALSLTRAGRAINPTDIYVSLSAEDAVAMQVGLHPEFSVHHLWDSYSDIGFAFGIGDREGPVTVYARFKDTAGNISELYQETIEVDRTKPENTRIYLEDHVYEVNKKDIVVSLDADGVTEMRLNTSPVFDGLPWEPYQRKKGWMLDGEDGTKEIYAQFRDAVGNTSRPVGMVVNLDRTAPSEAFVEIKEDFCIDKTRVVNLTLRAFGATKVRVSQNESFEGATWQRYKSKLRWVLADTDGEQTIYVQYADLANNLSSVVSDRVILDREPPRGAINIQGGKPLIDTLDVQLSITSEGEPKEMLLSNFPTFSPSTGWIPFEPTKNWSLAGGRDGVRFVYVRFRDEARNISLTYSDSIKIDRDGPIVHYFSINDGGTAIKGTEVTLYSKVDNVAYMMVSNTPDFKGASWEPYFDKKKWRLAADEGRQHVYVKFRDRIGNEATRIFSDAIMVYKKLFYISK